MEERITGLQQELDTVKNSRAGNEPGLVRLSSSQSVTDSTGLALPTSENNAAQAGTLANRILMIPSEAKKNLIGYEFYGNVDDTHNPHVIIKRNWDKFPFNSSCKVLCRTGSHWVADVFKSDNEYGSAIIQSYTTQIKYVRNLGGRWEVSVIENSLWEIF